MWAVVAAFAGACMLAALLVALANSWTAERVSMNATVLHRTNATLGSSALVRAAAGQVALFENLVAEGVASAEALDAASGELDSVVDSLSHLVAEVDEETAVLATAFIGAATDRPVDMFDVEAAYAPLRVHLVDEVHAVEDAIANNENTAQRLSLFLRVAVTLIIPIAVILFYRRRAASQVREARAEMNIAMEAERTIVRAKNDFVAGLSHEMRTPLTGIYGFSELLLDVVDDDAAREMVAEIHNQSAELARMVDDFIAMSRIDSDTMTFVSAPVAVDAVARSVAEQCDHGSKDITVVGSACPALADEAKVRQILTNLVSNAIQFGGDVIRIEIGEDADGIVCDVVDNGAGVPAETENRLFERFVNEGDQVLTSGSHGLGTWVAYTLASRMDGTLTYSRASGTTVFRLRLPPVQDTVDQAVVPAETLVSA